MTVTIEISDDVLAAFPGSESEVETRLRIELACGLYQRELASFASAAKVAGVHPFVFGHELTRRGIARHYGDEEVADDTTYVTGRQ